MNKIVKVNKKTIFAISIIVLVLLIDQSSKIWIKLNMMLGESIVVFDWFHIHFVENEGMAFGIKLGGDYGKLILSLFRIIAVAFIGVFLKNLLDRKESSVGLISSIALILAGAIGNIIDSAIYGVLFSDSVRQIATFLPEGGGYNPFLHGKVVDMLYFPLYDGFFPHWFPFWSGEYFSFFRPVFNIADTAITLGVMSIIVFQRNFFAELNAQEEEMIPTNTKEPLIETNISENTTSRQI